MGKKRIPVLWAASIQLRGMIIISQRQAENNCFSRRNNKRRRNFSRFSVAFRKPYSIRRALLLLQAQMVGDHRDELRIGRLALDVRHSVAEELLQHLEIAAVPGDLDGVADFQGFRPERGHALSEDLMLGNA